MDADPCAETVPIVEVHVAPPQHRLIIGCKIHHKCFHSSTPSVVEALAWHVLDEKSEITRVEETKSGMA